MKVKRIPKEIKDEILAKARTGGKVADLAKMYGLSDRTIYAWLQKDSGEETISALKYHKLQKENEELKRLIGELTLSLSIREKK
jgi:transposase-like protein